VQRCGEREPAADRHREALRRRTSLRVRLSTGDVRTAWVVATNSASDQAVLFLEEPAGVAPLDLVRRPQIPGTVLYFSGHPDRPRFQSARLDKIGRCPSLPDLPNALFTTIDGMPAIPARPSSTPRRVSWVWSTAARAARSRRPPTRSRASSTASSVAHSSS
jgi:hypothetical protein